MYHFVKIRSKDKPETKGFWYFVPNSIEQVQEHFNKIFGQEMAKLFATQISEEELLKKARQVWADINNTGNSYWNKDSDLVKEIKAQYSSRMKEEVNKIIETPAFKDQMQNDAKNFVDEMIKETRRKMIEEIRGRMAGIWVNGYGTSCGFSLKQAIEQTVIEMAAR